ncbi:MAG: nickel-dependent lactate racemase [Synergistaceae bacterium]|jgi:hypothetical protein|nr:nickel-dependent lactate racemase [Synergistaceae bacterium]
MSGIDAILEGVPIPRMVRVRQSLVYPSVKDVALCLSEKFAEKNALSGMKPGDTVAVTAGSRGITGLPVILRTVTSEIRAAGGAPFIFPAMGSHGGATAEGQSAMLDGMGISEDTVGAPVKSSMETVTVGETQDGSPVYMDKFASEADWIVVVNRIKPHVSFRGDYESGLMKMITVGMGKGRGAESAHRMGFGKMAENVLSFAKVVMAKRRILCAVGILENPNHETAELEVLRGDEIESREPELLRRAWELYPKLCFDRLDALALDEIGKDISGTGFDTNVLGRYHTRYASGGPDITRICVLDITDKSHGNGNGLGILDFTTRRAFEKFDFEQSYPNSLTSTVPMSVKIPMVLKNDMQAIQAAIRTCNVWDMRRVRFVRVKNTVSLGEMEISESLVEEASRHPNLKIISDPYDLNFDESGNLF